MNNDKRPCRQEPFWIRTQSEALSERSKNGSSNLAQLLFGIRKHASLHIVRQTHWIASTGMNEANSPVNSRKVEVCLFYYPRGELDNLFCR